jgi:hypothetical protein
LGELKKWLETPLGWAKANMMYDLADGPPPSGSLQESIFLIIAKRRQEAVFFQGKMLMEAMLAPHVEDAVKMMSKSYEAFKDSMLPFLAGETSRASKKTRELLKHWTGRGPMRVRVIAPPKDNTISSALKRGAERIRQSEESRRKVPHKRI